MMFLEWLRFILVALCMLGGMFTMIVAILGLYRFDFALNRIHSAAMGDTLSLFLFVLGLVIAVGWNVVALKLVLVLLLQWLTSPLASHMLAQFEYHADEHLAEHIDLSEAQFRQESDTEEVAAQ